MRRAATIRHRAGQTFAAAAAIAAAWSFIVALSGGISIHTGVSRIGTLDPIRPLIAAAACAAVAWRLLGTAESRRLADSVMRDRRKTHAGVAAIAAFGTLVVAIAWNTRAAGGSDSSCYVLQAEAFARGRASLAPPLASPPAVIPATALAPIGFVPSPAPPHHAVPICAPGLALVMAPAALIARDAVFLVVPVFAALAVWCTFLLGRALDQDLAGACAAVLLACSPIFLYQAVQPVSDVPAAALWLAALVALAPSARSSREAGRGRREIVAGICASGAVLMRPNMALIVLPLLALLRGRRAWLRFVVASLPAAAVMLGLNAARYGFPFAFDEWRYSRFLIPALPVLILFTLIGLRRLATGMPRLPWRLPQVRGAPLFYLAFSILVVWFVMRAMAGGVFDLQGLEARFRLAGQYAGRALTDAAIGIAGQQSGSIRYHGRRGTLAWDGLPEGGLDAAVAALAASGRTVYFALEEAEEPRFRARFAGERFGGLDWPPFAEVHGPARVRFYDPRQRDRYRAGLRYNVEIVGRVRTR